jgi:octaprenyl-diphosphate synthase
MTLASSLHVLADTAADGRAHDRAVSRIEDVRGLVARELGEVEAIVARHIAKGVEPATDSAKHLFDAGGKRVRPLALLLACACFGSIDARARDLAAAAELVHMATLLHDDVIDDGDQRRGRPTSRRIWGNAVSVLAGDLLLVEALRLGCRAQPETWSELVSTLGRLVDGEVVQLRGRHQVSLDEATYFEILRGKTASLFEWALRAGAREGGARAEAIDALGRFGGHLGMAFQLVDDVLDYDGESAATGKTMLADLAEGKVTLPLIWASASPGDLDALVARVRAGEEVAATELADRVRGSGACKRVRALALEETAKALAALESVPACRPREILSEVAAGLSLRLS